MPQMLPLNWLFLYIFFILLYIFFLKLNYFSYKPFFLKNNNNIIFLNNKLNWKW
uniref:ATP synthase F0 subunit 8 n=1 Tax=Anisocentropus kawamurai TaxID=2481046 RepID=UPI0022DCDD62|nr:ATP synthase F0 subunit 8 [Anisocentropus kawamurai]UZZ43743.1 ATP synthase F0 subunit 8 [Anisocentropus kawamurai]